MIESFKRILDTSRTVAEPLFRRHAYPWDVLNDISEFIRDISKDLGDDFYSPSEGLYISKSATVDPSARLCPPCIIGEGSDVRYCALIRGNVIVGRGCVVGHSSELKSCLLFDGAKAPHFNYVGDSVLGHNAHLGAGVILSNLRSDRNEVIIAFERFRVASGRKKLGATVGDRAEIGCNAVLCPGSVIGNDTTVYPLSTVRGYLPPNAIFKGNGNVVPKKGGK